MIDTNELEQNQSGERNNQAGRDIIYIENQNVINGTHNKLTKKKIYSITIIVLVIIVLSFSHILKPTEGQKTNTTTSEEIVENKEESSSEELISEEQILNLTFYSIYELDEYTVNRAFALLEERLSILTNEYTIEIDESKFKVSIPKDALIPREAKEQDLYEILHLISWSSTKYMYLVLDNENFNRIYHDEIVKYEINETWIDGPALIIYLDIDAYNRIMPILEQSKVDDLKIALCNDYDEQSYGFEPHWGVNVGSIYDYNESEHAIILVNDVLQYGKLYDFFATCIMQEPLPFLFGWEINFSRAIEWDNLKLAAEPKENQVDNLEGVTIDLIYRAVNESEKDSEETWMLANRLMKRRLESLNIEYQYGKWSLGDKGIAVRIPLKYANIGIVEFLSTNKKTAYITNINGTRQFPVKNLNYFKTSDGNIMVTVTLKDSDKERLVDYKNENPNVTKLLFLEIAGQRISSLPLQAIYDVDALVFRDFYFSGKEFISEEYECLISLLCYLSNEEFRTGLESPYKFVLQTYSINKPETELYEYKFEVEGRKAYYAYIYEYVDNNPEIFSKYVLDEDEITFYIKKADNIAIHYDEFLEIVEKTFNQLNLEDSNFYRITFIQPNDKRDGYYDSDSHVSFKFDENINAFRVSYLQYYSWVMDNDSFNRLLLERDFWLDKVTDESITTIKKEISDAAKRK